MSLNESITRRLLGLWKAPGRRSHTPRSQSTMPSRFIQPLACTRKTTPTGTAMRGIVFLFNMMVGGSLVPSAMQARTTVKWDFSCPVVLTKMDLAPFSWTVRLVGISKQTGTSSMFPICAKSISRSCLQLITKRWNSSTLAVKSSGNFCARVVLSLMAR